MPTTSNAVVVEKAAEKTGAERTGAEKAPEKLAEKRRALGRGLESLLGGASRAVSLPTPTAGRAGTAVAPLTSTAVAAENVIALEPAIVSSENVPAAGTTQAATGGGNGEAGSVAELQAVAGGWTSENPVFELAIDQIDENPHQTRVLFDQELLEELAHSIQVQGVIQPIVVRPGKEEGRYILILGDRRLRASKLAGKTTIPVMVKRVSEQQAAEMTLVENLQREDLDCLEQAQAFANLSLQFKLTQEEIGKRVGSSRETVSNYLRLLKLPADVIFALRRGALSYSHARALLTLGDESQISKVAQIAIHKKMSVIQLEDLVLDLNVPTGRPEEPKRGGGARWVDPNVRAAQRSLETVLGMRVRIRDRKGKGKITIEYGTLEDFDRVVRMLKGKVTAG